MATDWTARLYFFIRSVDATTANKNTVAGYLANNGSMESAADELEMFTSPVKLSTSGALPAQAFGFNLAVKSAMRTAFANFLPTLTNARFAVVANTQLAQYDYLELIATNFNVTPRGQIVSWQTALDYLFDEFGLQVIPDEPV